MKLHWLLFSYILLISGCSDSELQYGVNGSKISGALSCGEHEHPSGRYFEFCVVKLDHQVSIAEEKDNPINSAESGINEIQVFSSDIQISKAIKAKRNTEVILIGEIFHEHTAWHVRKLVMDVHEIK